MDVLVLMEWILTDERELMSSCRHEDGANEENDNIGLKRPLATDLFRDFSIISLLYIQLHNKSYLGNK